MNFGKVERENKIDYKFVWLSYLREKFAWESTHNFVDTTQMSSRTYEHTHTVLERYPADTRHVNCSYAMWAAAASTNNSKNNISCKWRLLKFDLYFWVGAGLSVVWCGTVWYEGINYRVHKSIYKS